jgi:hypothetical protein
MLNHKVATQKLTVIGSSLVMVCAMALSGTGRFSKEPGQAKEKVIEAPRPPDAPVQIDELKVSGKSIKVADKFEADESWLSHLSLKLKNKSSKTVVGIQMDLFFPETKATGNMMAFPLKFGQEPLAGSGSPPRLTSGDTTEIALSQNEYAKLKNFIERRHSIGSINKVTVQVNTIYFEDGTIWSYGSWVRRDSANPLRLIPVENQ